MKTNSLITSDGTVVTWEGELLEDTMVTLGGTLIVPVGSWVSHTHGGALEDIEAWKKENKDSS